MLARHAATRLLEALDDTPVVYLQGARQTGKSTLAKRLAEQRFASYLTLDTAAVLAAATNDPDGFVAGLARPAVIDEAQRAQALPLAIKAAVDADRRPGQFLLTGSAGALALPKLADSLAGRMELHMLWPFSQGETQGVRETFIDRLFAEDLAPPPVAPCADDEVIDRLCGGGYPDALARRAGRRRSAWFDAYVTTVLERDVRSLANIDRLLDLPRLLGLLAARVGQLINHADLARSLGLPQTTLKRYMALLEATFLVCRLPAWFTNVGKRLAKAPKLLLADTGLLMHLLDVDATRLARDRTLLGHALEANPEASLHLEDGERAVILEGRVGKTTPDAALAATLAAQANAKYEWADAPDSAYQAESLIFRPRKAMAWTLLYKDATRFTFA